MTPVLDAALTNALLAVPLAALAWASTALRRPAVTHTLWLIVLLRLVAPPLWQVTVPVTKAAPVIPMPEPPAAPVPAAVVVDVEVKAAQPIFEASPPPVATKALTRSIDWSSLLACGWLAGSAFVVIACAARILAFARVVRHARPATAGWQRTSDAIARRLGLWRRPRVAVVPGAVSPLVWAGFGPAIVLVPQGLVDSLNGSRRAAILAHELAHLRRGDHIVRWLEVVVTATAWWNPIVWWARRELRECEEQCCDAWVVWALPAARRAYADALVDTVDFLNDARPALPPLASGVGAVRDLRRRITMILRDNVPRRLTRLGLVAGLALGLVAVAVTPGRGDDEPEQPPPPKRDGRGDQPPRDNDRHDAERGRERRPVDPEKARQANAIRDELRAMREKMQAMEEKLADLEGRPRRPREDNIRREATRREFERAGPNPPKDAERRIDERRLEERRRDPVPPPKEFDRRPGAGPRPGGDRLSDLERELQMLRRELAELRRELRHPEGHDPQRQPQPPRLPQPPSPPTPPTPEEK